METYAKENGLELVDVDFEKEGADWYLRVFLDKAGGIFINDCVDASRYLDAQLEAVDPLETPYHLEVSSPGLDRPMKKDKDYARSLGKLLEVRLFRPRTEGAFAGQKEFTAKLCAYDPQDAAVTLEQESGAREVFHTKDFAMIRLAVIF